MTDINHIFSHAIRTINRLDARLSATLRLGLELNEEPPQWYQTIEAQSDLRNQIRFASLAFCYFSRLM